MVAGLIAGGLCVVVLVIWSAMSGRGSGALPAPPGGSDLAAGNPAVPGTTPRTPTTVTPTAEQNAANLAAYEARLERDRLKAAEVQKGNLQRQYGANKVVTVIVNGVPGDPVAADRYLNRKLFRASYHDYSEASKRAQTQTQQNQKRAEQQALSQAQQQRGGLGGFSPLFVHYRYQEVRSDLPYPQIIPATKANGTFIYHAAPVLALDQFVLRFDIGSGVKIDPASRTVTIQAQLPNPVPDPDVEELSLQYGSAAVAKIKVKGAVGAADRVTYFLETETGKLDPKINLAVAGVKALGLGEYELYVAPVNDLRVFAERIGYGAIVDADQATRIITIEAKLPEELAARPTPAELEAIRQKEWEAHRNKPSDHDIKPREGEDFYVWALRVLKGNIPWATKAALLELKLREVDEAHLKEVSETLIATLKDSWHVSEHLEAMAVWKGEGTEKAILGLIGEIRFHSYSKTLMNILAGFGTKESARALATGLTDFSYGDEAATALIEMGAVAEEFVIKFADHQDDRIRTRVYNILAEIGTEKSLTKLRSNMNKEKKPFMKNHVKEVIDQIKQRTDEAKAASDPASSLETKPKK